MASPGDGEQSRLSNIEELPISVEEGGELLKNLLNSDDICYVEDQDWLGVIKSHLSSYLGRQENDTQRGRTEWPLAKYIHPDAIASQYFKKLASGEATIPAEGMKTVSYCYQPGSGNHKDRTGRNGDYIPVDDLGQRMGHNQRLSERHRAQIDIDAPEVELELPAIAAYAHEASAVMRRLRSLDSEQANNRLREAGVEKKKKSTVLLLGVVGSQLTDVEQPSSEALTILMMAEIAQMHPDLDPEGVAEEFYKWSEQIRDLVSELDGSCTVPQYLEVLKKLPSKPTITSQEIAVARAAGTLILPDEIAKVSKRVTGYVRGNVKTWERFLAGDTTAHEDVINFIQELHMAGSGYERRLINPNNPNQGVYYVDGQFAIRGDSSEEIDAESLRRLEILNRPVKQAYKAKLEMTFFGGLDLLDRNYYRLCEDKKVDTSAHMRLKLYKILIKSQRYHMQYNKVKKMVSRSVAHAFLSLEIAEGSRFKLAREILVPPQD